MQVGTSIGTRQRRRARVVAIEPVERFLALPWGSGCRGDEVAFHRSNTVCVRGNSREQSEYSTIHIHLHSHHESRHSGATQHADWQRRRAPCMTRDPRAPATTDRRAGCAQCSSVQPSEPRLHCNVAAQEESVARQCRSTDANQGCVGSCMDEGTCLETAERVCDTVGAIAGAVVSSPLAVIPGVVPRTRHNVFIVHTHLP